MALSMMLGEAGHAPEKIETTAIVTLDRTDKGPTVTAVHLDVVVKVPNLDAVRAPINDWCVLHLGETLQITNIKDFGMVELWDDRAVQVIPNTGERVDGASE